ncbi:MAG: hypothetical protein SWE60_05940 [Thermodesulfobacteriota bacterium]|nr:hypothetical protein [Thermodesulfobacteriota bacterium]
MNEMVSQTELIGLPFTNPSCFVALAILMAASAYMLGAYDRLRKDLLDDWKKVFRFGMGFLIVFPFMCHLIWYILAASKLVDTLLNGTSQLEPILRHLIELRQAFFRALWLSLAFMFAAFFFEPYRRSTIPQVANNNQGRITSTD